MHLPMIESSILQFFLKEYKEDDVRGQAAVAMEILS